MGPVFLTYREGEAIQAKVAEVVKEKEPYGKVKTEDGIVHTLWQIPVLHNKFFEKEFEKIECTYVADGHHRSAAAYNVGRMRRALALKKHGKITGREDFNYFMSILYPAE